MAVPWPRPRAAPHCRPARPTAAPSWHRTGRRTALRTRPSGRLPSGGRAGPSPRPLPGHCCPLGWHGRRRLGRIRSGARSLGQHRQLRPPRLPPPLPPAPQGAVGAGKTESSMPERQKVKPFTAYFHARQQAMKSQVQTEEGGHRAKSQRPQGILPTERSRTMSNGLPGSRWSIAIRHSSNIAHYQFRRRGTSAGCARGRQPR